FSSREPVSTSLENALAAKAAEHRRLAGQHGRLDIAVHGPGILLAVSDAERQAEVGGRLEFDTRKRAGARREPGGQRRKRTADAVAIFQGVETGKERNGHTAGRLVVVAELRARIRKRASERAEIGCCSSLAEAAQANAAAFAADEETVRKV